MKAPKARYPINQCALYKCRTRKKLESLLTIEPGGLRNIQKIIEYHSFSIDKKNSTEKRAISAPNRILKAVQARILTLLKYIERPDWLISGEKGKSYINNGKAHLDANYMLAVDIKSFYDNCERDYVYRFFVDKMQTAPDVAKILTDIVTFNATVPTGCPTSQIIAYYAYEDMFAEIARCAQDYNCKFTLYVDDMTFSSINPISSQKLARAVDIILRRYGHRPKYRKVKYYSAGEAKPVTGTIITPNHELAVPNSLQKRIYDNFQVAKDQNEQGMIQDLTKTTQALIGQIQASRNLVPEKFPEILRLANEMKDKQDAIVKTNPSKRTRRKRKQVKIKLD